MTPELDYSLLDRLLHQIALGSKSICSASFDLESRRYQAAAPTAAKSPIFIAGLARSGSTILLNTLYETGEFRSLTYRDMPFIMMPGTWRKLSAASARQRIATERAHGDRITVDYDSPEAFEEVFWKTFLGERYIFSDHVESHGVPQSVARKFRQFVQHVLYSSDDAARSRYLSKNNNNLLRLPSLHAIFTDAHILVPFRDPLQHASSLLRQHQRFLDIHSRDNFSRKYMAWLGHYEFGESHREYRFDTGANPYSSESIDYWLHTWLCAHRHALQSASGNTLLLGYEQLCMDGERIFSKLYPLLGIAGAPALSASQYVAAESAVVQGADEDLLRECNNVFEQLNQVQLEILGL